MGGFFWHRNVCLAWAWNNSRWPALLCRTAEQVATQRHEMAVCSALFHDWCYGLDLAVFLGRQEKRQTFVFGSPLLLPYSMMKLLYCNGCPWGAPVTTSPNNLECFHFFPTTVGGVPLLSSQKPFLDR